MRGTRVDQRLPPAAYAHAESIPLYHRVWAIESRQDLDAVLASLPDRVMVRGAMLAARLVEPILEREHPGDRRLPIAIAAIDRYLAGGLDGDELDRFVAPALQSAAHGTTGAASDYVRATFTVLHALHAARCAAAQSTAQPDALAALQFAALTVGYDCRPIRGVLAPVVREHLAREWTARMLRVARDQGVRLYGSLADRAVAVDVALDA